jgi:glutaredoxin-like YruB-family protein
MVKIYTTPSCHYCKLAKEYFKSKNVDYSEVNVISDVAAQKEMIEKTGQFGVPVININGKFIIGFDREKIDSALN